MKCKCGNVFNRSVSTKYPDRCVVCVMLLNFHAETCVIFTTLEDVCSCGTGSVIKRLEGQPTFTCGTSRMDKRFAQSAPCYMGITQRILRGYKGVHPNA